MKLRPLRLFQSLCLTASIVGTKHRSIKPANRKKKIMTLFIQFHYKREAFAERTVQVEFPVITLV